MKRINLYFILFCLFCFSFSFLPSRSSFLDDFILCDNSRYVFYTSKCNYCSSISKNTLCGNMSIISCDYTNRIFVEKNINNILGEAIQIGSNLINKLDNTLLKNGCQLRKEEIVNDILIKYYYSNKYEKFVTINDKMINIEVAVGSDCITIGYPVIYGSF